MSLLRVPEGSAEYPTLGDLLSMADNDGNGNSKKFRGRGGVEEDEAVAEASAGPYRPSLEPARSWI